MRFGATMVPAALLPLLSPAVSVALSDKAERQRREIRAMARGTIEDLCRPQPRSREALKGTAGYAACSNLERFIHSECVNSADRQRCRPN